MIEAIRASGRAISCVGFLDSDEEKWGRDFYGYPILGGMDQVAGIAQDGVSFVNLITGSTAARHSISQEIVRCGGELTNFIHPSIDLTMTEMGVGNYLQEGVILQAEVELGWNCSIHMGAKIGHESKIGDSTFIAHEVSVSGCCNIGSGVFLGTNATVLPRITIGDWATIGAGAVVTKDVPPGGVVVGNPGRVVRIADLTQQSL